MEVGGSSLPPGTRDFARPNEVWRARTTPSLNIASGTRSYIQGEELEIEYVASMETSSDNIFIPNTKFELKYPKGVTISNITLSINNKAIAFHDCGCPDKSWRSAEGAIDPKRMDLSLNQVINELHVRRISHKDIVKVLIKGVATEVGAFPISMEFKEGFATFTKRNQNTRTIGFSTAEDETTNIDGGAPALGQIEIIPFGTNPVELNSFNVNTSGQFTIISWSTALEINNDFFTIERSSDGRNFHKIGKVEGKGDYSGITEYQFEDRAPLRGTSFYRLTQTDFDGTSKTFAAQRAIFNREANAGVTILKNPKFKRAN